MYRLIAAGCVLALSLLMPHLAAQEKAKDNPAAQKLNRDIPRHKEPAGGSAIDRESTVAQEMARGESQGVTSMTETLSSFLWPQLAYAAPVLLVSTVGLVLAIAFFRRHPFASILTLLGTGFLLLVTVTGLVAQTYLFHLRMEDRWTVERFAHWMSIIGIASSIGRAIGLALIVTAVFIERGPSLRPGSGPLEGEHPSSGRRG
jgi:hypothetical protein